MLFATAPPLLHGPASFGAFAAAFRAFLAVRMIVLRTLRGAPVTDVGAKRTVLFGVFTVARHEFYGDQTSIHAIHAAAGAVVHTFFGRHSSQTGLTIDQAFLAGRDTIGILLGNSRVGNGEGHLGKS